MPQLAVLKSPPDELFWSAPMALDSEFSAEDPLALDYLGQQVGLWLFPNFTTRTSRAQYYAVVLYGLHLVDQAVQKYRYPGDDGTRIKLFERWERFWALAAIESVYENGRVNDEEKDAMRGMRGVQGAKKAWVPGDKPLSIDFDLIARQKELGAFGAYIGSLRKYGLVHEGSLLIQPSAKEIVKSFWLESGKDDKYEEYALTALRLKSKKIDRSFGRLALARLGKRSRLSCLHDRPDQQQRLWNALFAGARDPSTLPLSEKLIAAHKDDASDPKPFLEGTLGERWGTLSTDNKNRVEVALRFGKVARVLLERFNRAYGHVYENAWNADSGKVAERAFPEDDAQDLREVCTDVLNTQNIGHFKDLEHHGPKFIKLVSDLKSSGPEKSLQLLLEFHRAVQGSRRRGGAWLRDERGRIVMWAADYNGHHTEAEFPHTKIYTMRSLLTDLGKIQ